VTNSGNGPLTGSETVTDDKTPTVSCDALGRAARAGRIDHGTSSYTVTQADWTAGSVTNSDSRRSTGRRVEHGRVTVPRASAGVFLVKSTPAAGYGAVGDSIPPTKRDALGNVTWPGAHA